MADIQDIILDNIKAVHGEVSVLRAEIGVVLEKHNELSRKCNACETEKKIKDSVYYRVGSFIMTAILAGGLAYSFMNLFQQDKPKEEKNNINISSIK